MIRCPNCNTNNPIGTLYCENCGSALSIPKTTDYTKTCLGTLLFVLSLPLGICGAVFTVHSFEPGAYLSGPNPIAWAGLLIAAVGIYYGYRLMTGK